MVTAGCLFIPGSYARVGLEHAHVHCLVGLLPGSRLEFSLMNKSGGGVGGAARPGNVEVSFRKEKAR